MIIYSIVHNYKIKINNVVCMIYILKKDRQDTTYMKIFFKVGFVNLKFRKIEIST
jgi:hypothetical protein